MASMASMAHVEHGARPLPGCITAAPQAEDRSHGVRRTDGPALTGNLAGHRLRNHARGQYLARTVDRLVSGMPPVSLRQEMALPLQDAHAGSARNGAPVSPDASGSVIPTPRSGDYSILHNSCQATYTLPAAKGAGGEDVCPPARPARMVLMVPRPAVHVRDRPGSRSSGRQRARKPIRTPAASSPM